MQDTGAESEFPYDPKVAEAVAGDVLDDKMDESEDKEMILGDDMLNPFTGAWGQRRWEGLRWAMGERGGEGGLRSRGYAFMG